MQPLLSHPSGCFRESLPLLVLGHFAEGHGEHYVSLDGPIFHYIQAVQEAEMHRVSLGINSQPGPLSDTEDDPMSDTEPNPTSDTEPCPLSNTEPGPTCMSDTEP